MKQILTSVIVFFEEKDDFDLLKGILSCEFSIIKGVDITSGKFSFAKKIDFDEVIFVYAFGDPESATNYRKHLHDEASEIFQRQHAEFLFTHREYSKQAFQLCVQGVFDSYDCYKPVYDNNHLIFTLYKLTEIFRLNRELNDLQQKNSRHNDTLDELTENSVNLSEQVAHDINESKQTSAIARTEVDKLFDEIPYQQLKEEMTKVLNDAGNKVLAEYFNNVKQNMVEVSLDSLDNTNNYIFTRLQKELVKQQDLLSKMQPPTKKELSVGAILLIDDQEFIVKTLSSILESKGFAVSSADNGVEGLIRAELTRPDVILLDIDMPKMDGLLTLNKIKNNPNLNALPVVMLTGNSDRESVQKCLSAGAADYIVKPVNANTLLKKLKRVLYSE